MKRLAPPVTKAMQRVFVDEMIYRLRLLRAQLHNRPAKAKRRTTAPKTTPHLRRRMKLLYDEGHSMQEIARHLRVSSGRVSETLSGKRR